MDADLSRKFAIPSSRLSSFVKTLHEDAQFLATHNIMDHSLIVGIFKRADAPASKKKKQKSKRKERVDAEEANSVGRRGMTLFHSNNGEEVFAVGIIDILQDYNMKKKMAHLLKATIHDSVRHWRRFVALFSLLIRFAAI